MTNIKVSIKEGHLAIIADGHANYDQQGRDIVCAAISAILQTAVYGLEAIAEQYPEHVSIKFGD